LWRLPLDGGAPQAQTPTDGVHTVAAAGPGVVVQRQHADDASVTTTVRHDDTSTAVPHVPVDLPLRPRPHFATLDGLCAALLLPSWHTGDRLPVLLAPYGGPHARRVRQAARAFLTDQWFAEAGFAVLVIDGRGTPGRGLAWEHVVRGDLATPALVDQERGVRAAAARWPALDLDRVAIRGWSFGGYLAALAVLRRPEVFHAAIAGAPVTDWALYDTHYTERYLGDPATQAAAYARSSLLDDAAGLRRPLLLRTHTAAVRGAGGGRPPAHGAAAVDHHPRRPRPPPRGAAARPAAGVPPRRPRHHAARQPVTVVGFRLCIETISVRCVGSRCPPITSTAVSTPLRSTTGSTGSERCSSACSTTCRS
jgi:pimeloyl-ACP methyl ester carboxylesterase